VVISPAGVLTAPPAPDRGAHCSHGIENGLEAMLLLTDLEDFVAHHRPHGKLVADLGPAVGDVNPR